MKLTYKEKVKIYREWKTGCRSYHDIARQYQINYENIRHMAHLADRYTDRTDSCYLQNFEIKIEEQKQLSRKDFLIIAQTGIKSWIK